MAKTHLHFGNQLQLSSKNTKSTNVYMCAKVALTVSNTLHFQLNMIMLQQRCDLAGIFKEAHLSRLYPHLDMLPYGYNETLGSSLTLSLCVKLYTLQVDQN